MLTFFSKILSFFKNEYNIGHDNPVFFNRMAKYACNIDFRNEEFDKQNHKGHSAHKELHLRCKIRIHLFNLRIKFVLIRSTCVIRVPRNNAGSKYYKKMILMSGVDGFLTMNIVCIKLKSKPLARLHHLILIACLQHFNIYNFYLIVLRN